MSDNTFSLSEEAQKVLGRYGQALAALSRGPEQEWEVVCTLRLPGWLEKCISGELVRRRLADGWDADISSVLRDAIVAYFSAKRRDEAGREDALP